VKKLIPAAIILILLGLWIYVDGVKGSNEEVAVSTKLVATASVSDPPALDSAWYCPLGTRNEGGFADHSVIISNIADTVANAKITVLTEDGIGSSKVVEVAANSTNIVSAREVDPISDTSKSIFAAMQVEITGGNGVVSHSITTADGLVADGICATKASQSWHFSTGRINEDSKEYIAIMNPFEEDVSVDILLDSWGRTATTVEAFQGLTLFANTVQIIEIHSAPGLKGRDHVAAVVKSRSGRIIVERLQIVDESIFAADEAISLTTEASEETEDSNEDTEPAGPDGSKVTGAALQLGTKTPSTDWFFTSGRVNENSSHFLTIYNPKKTDVETIKEDTADIVVEIWPNSASDREVYLLTPIQREVRPGELVIVDLVFEVNRFQFDLPLDFSVQVISNNDVPVVTERWQFGRKVGDDFSGSIELDVEDPQTGDALDPIVGEDENPKSPDSMTTGLAVSNGIEFEAAKSWVVPWIRTPSSTSSWLTIFSTQPDTEVTVEYKTLAGSQSITVAIPIKNNRAFVNVPVLASDSSISGGAVKINSNNPIYVDAQVNSETGSDVMFAAPVIKLTQ